MIKTTCNWLSYEFSIRPYTAPWSNHGGIYIFAGPTDQHRWRPYYIGQADNIADRIPSHEKWNQAVRLRANAVHVFFVYQPETRARIEAELIRHFRPALNIQIP